METIKNKIKKRLCLYYKNKSSMVRSCINGSRRPNGDVRNDLRDIVPFDKWGREFSQWLAEQEAEVKKPKKAKK